MTSHLYLGPKEFSLPRPISLKAPKTSLFLQIRRITKLHKMTAMKRQRRQKTTGERIYIGVTLGLEVEDGPQFSTKHLQALPSDTLIGGLR